MPRSKQRSYPWEGLPSVDRVERFFLDAGLRVGRSPQGLAVAGRLFDLEEIPTTLLFVDWAPRIDVFVATQLRERLETAFERHGRPLLGDDVTMTSTSNGLEVGRGDLPIATIRATAARAATGAIVGGNFLVEGDQWRQLAVATNEAPAEVRPATVRAGDRDAFFRGLDREIDHAYAREPRLPDRRTQFQWVTGYLGDPFAPVWFVAESPSLTRLEAGGTASRDPELQWSVSPGDKLFRRMLAEHGFKEGGPFERGGWRCYITDVIKSSYRVKDWQASGDDVRLAVAEAWANVLHFELEHGAPQLVVILGDKTAKPLKHLVRKRLVPELPDTVTIYHYSYIGSRPQGRLGPMHPERVAAWGREFAAIAARANALAAE